MADDAKVSVTLPADLAALVNQAVASGAYATSSDVVLEALQEWRQRRELTASEAAELGRLWDEGVASGPGRFNGMAEIKREARRRLAATRDA